MKRHNGQDNLHDQKDQDSNNTIGDGDACIAHGNGSQLSD
jgi:hypothetical protein